jgi:hypothetical protein
MKLSYRQAAEALGICSAAVGFYSRGTRRTTKDGDASPVEVPMTVLLACNAVENQLPPIK